MRAGFLVTSLGLELVLTSCGPTPTLPTFPDAVGTPVPPVAYREAILVDVCLQTGARYPRAQARAALALVTQSVAAMLQANAAGGIVYVTLADAAPTRPEQTVSVLTIPPTHALPTPPAPTPTPTTSERNPYASAAAQATVASQNQAVMRRYRAQLALVDEQLATVRAQVAGWAKRLRAHALQPGPGPANMGQCVALASQRFNNARAEKYLVLAGALSAPGQNATWYSLAGVHTRWIFADCSDVQSCQAGESAWARVLAHAGIRDLLFFDPGESQALSNLFGTPTNHA